MFGAPRCSNRADQAKGHCYAWSDGQSGYLERSEAITELRGQFHMRGQAKVMPTYHPAYLLKVPKAKATVWHDLQIVMTELGLKGR